MKTVWKLPDKYHQVYRLDLQKDKKLSILVTVAALVIAAAMIIPVAFLKPLYFYGDAGSLGILLISMIGYIFLHEWVHGLCIRYFSGKKAYYGFTGLYAFAASKAYFPKKPYIIIALAPVVVWGIVLAVLLFLLPANWFWPVYLIQVINISGAAGDLYVTCRLIRMPKDLLVQDSGAAMEIYTAS